MATTKIPKIKRSNYKLLYEGAIAELRSVRARLGAATKKIKSQEQIQYCEFNPTLDLMLPDYEETMTSGQRIESDVLQKQLDENKNLIESLTKEVNKLMAEKDDINDSLSYHRGMLSDLNKKCDSLEAANGHLIAAMQRIDIARNI